MTQTEPESVLRRSVPPREGLAAALRVLIVSVERETMRRFVSALLGALVVLGTASARPAPPSHYNGQLLRVLVVVSEHRTYLFNNAGDCIRVFPDATGAPWSPSPTGLYHVRQVIGQQAAYADSRSSYGTPYVYGPRIIDLGPNRFRPGFDEALHGTDQPWTIGHDASEGCIRHYNRDIITIARHVHAGDRVAIVEAMSDRHLR